MRKIRLLLEYDGADYHGWQAQPEEITVQGALEDRIRQLTGEPAKVLGAGRTDAGVHALAQGAAFRTESAHDISTIKKALNATLPEDIRIIGVSEVLDSFNPRNDALGKSRAHPGRHGLRRSGNLTTRIRLRLRGASGKNIA
jgi:tRNA pseudouridine38-40 synthase